MTAPRLGYLVTCGVRVRSSKEACKWNEHSWRKSKIVARTSDHPNQCRWTVSERAVGENRPRHPQAKHTKTHHRFALNSAHTCSSILGIMRESRHGFQFSKNSPKYGKETNGRKVNSTIKPILLQDRFGSSCQRAIVKRLRMKKR